MVFQVVVFHLLFPSPFIPYPLAQIPGSTSFIRERCLALIRKSSMHEGHWEMTVLDSLHSPIKEVILLSEDEYPLISFFAGKGDWTVYTSHRLIGEVDSSRTEIKREAFDSCKWGDFKQDLDSPRVTVAHTRHLGEGRQFLYESGYASMAPIYYFIFWELKWPVWRKTYQIENGGKA
ncbi:hypothetical protein BH09VER1_BH09VER1_55910 [soil metagenome]